MKKSAPMLLGTRRLLWIATTGVGIACGAAIAVGAPGAVDVPVGVAIEWSYAPGAATCTPGVDLAREVSTRLQLNRLVALESAEVVLHVRIAPVADPPGFSATITSTVRGGRLLGRRELAVAAVHCSALDPSLALVLTMMADASLAEQIGRSDPPVGVHGTAAASTSRPATTAPAPVPSATRRHAVTLSVAGELGRLPGHPVAVEVGIALRLSQRARLDLSLAAWSIARVETDAGAARLRAAAGSARLCVPALAGARLRLLGCAGLLAGLTRARGSGFVENRAPAHGSLDGVLGARAELAVAGRWFVHLGAGFLAGIWRPRLTYESDSGAVLPLYEATPVGAKVDFGTGLVF